MLHASIVDHNSSGTHVSVVYNVLFSCWLYLVDVCVCVMHVHSSPAVILNPDVIVLHLGGTTCLTLLEERLVLYKC